VQAVLRHSILGQAQLSTMGLTENAICVRLYHLSVLLLGILATSEANKSICLAFCDGSSIISRALRTPRCMRDWGVRTNLLAAVSLLSTLDDNACICMLDMGLFATVEQHLFVRTLFASFPTSPKCIRASQRICFPFMVGPALFPNLVLHKLLMLLFLFCSSLCCFRANCTH
jgi:hypothetical protein